MIALIGVLIITAGIFPAPLAVAAWGFAWWAIVGGIAASLLLMWLGKVIAVWGIDNGC